MRATKNVAQAIERIAPLVADSMLISPAEERGRYVLTPALDNPLSVNVTLRGPEALARLVLCCCRDEAVREAVRWRGKVPARMDGKWDGDQLEWLKGWQK